MAKEPKNNIPNKPKFNPYWIYGIVLAAIIGFQLISGGFGSSDPVNITPAKFIEYLKKGPSGAKVEKVDIEWMKYTGRYTGFNVIY